MHLVALFALAIGLAMDATAVAATRGFIAPRLRVPDVARVALLFGGFQALMPALGWAAGARFAPLVAAWGHWVAFGLLAGLGGKMLREAMSAKDDGPVTVVDPFAWRALFALAVATSIDALAAGVTLPLLGARLAPALVVIGTTTVVLSTLGLYLGKRFGDRFGRRLDAFGGLLLIALGIKALAEHYGASLKLAALHIEILPGARGENAIALERDDASSTKFGEAARCASTGVRVSSTGSCSGHSSRSWCSARRTSSPP